LRKLISKILLLAAPILICGAFVLFVDPFNYFRLLKIIPSDKKQEVVYKDDRLLWNIIAYSKDPSPGVIIGDSRADRFSSERLSRKSGSRYMHLSASACKINEIADLFRFADSYGKLRSVIVVIHFNMYNRYAFADRVTGAEAVLANPLLYLFNRHVIKTAYTICKSVLSAGKTAPSKPPGSRDEFWAWSLNHWANQQYGKWGYPADGYEKLRRMAETCGKKNIRLVFIIAPHHADYQEKVAQFNLGIEQVQFKEDISSLSTTYDFDFANELTGNRENFSDPVHVREEVANQLIDEIVTGQLRFGRMLTSR